MPEVIVDPDLVKIVTLIVNRKPHLDFTKLFTFLDFFFCKAYVRGRRSMSFPRLYGFTKTFYFHDEAAHHIMTHSMKKL
jgi:hypothetical protein